MIIKGGARSGRASYIGYLAWHLQRTDTNEGVVVLEIRGTVATDLRGAFREMSAIGLGTNSSEPLYHLNIDPSPDEPPLTKAQIWRAIERAEEELGLTGQPRIAVEHIKEGRPHLHVVWCRIDIERMVAISDAHNYRRHEIAARALEVEFGHKWVQGAHVGRNGQPRPDRAPSDAEMRQTERSYLHPTAVRSLVTLIWRTADSGEAFRTALVAEGAELARGDRRDFVIIDPAGEVHSLRRRIEGASAGEIRARMADIDPATLPTVAEAQAAQRQRWQVIKQDLVREAADQVTSGEGRTPTQVTPPAAKPPEMPASMAVCPSVSYPLDVGPEKRGRKRPARKQVTFDVASSPAERAEMVKGIKLTVGRNAKVEPPTAKLSPLPKVIKLGVGKEKPPSKPRGRRDKGCGR